MSIYKDIKKAFASTIDVLADKTSTQAQKSRLVTVMKNEEKIANQAYIALGKYLYASMREGLPEDVEQLCSVIDASKERMTRAQDIYREVIRQDEVNTEIGKTELKENFRKVKEPIVSGAVNKAAKASILAKDTAAKAEELKVAAAEKAEEVKTKIRREKEELEEKAEAALETVEEIIDTETETTAIDAENIESAVMEDTQAAPEQEPEVPVQADEEAMPMPVEMISEEDFEEDEPEVKPIEKRDPISKARKLKDIMTKKDEE